ncbi:MAG: recombination regulator RecX [Firmicutes bacterium]|nr:recombination regulator RecX [Bacillota bacterium]
MSHPANALDYAMRLLARRDHTRRELFARLSGKGFSPAESEEAIARLVAWGYLDERAIARRWVEDCQMRRPRGRALAAAELEARGIPEEIVREALSHYPPAREERVARAALARLGIRIPVPPPDRPRAWRALLRLGFPEPLAARLCGVPDA